MSLLRVLQSNLRRRIGPKWILIILLGSLCSLYLYIKYGRDDTLMRAMLININELTDKDKCPACFGVYRCPQFFDGSIELTEWTKYSITRLVNSKNIFYASMTFEGVKTDVVLKKLANDNELEDLDKTICQRRRKRDPKNIDTITNTYVNDEDKDFKCNVKEAVKFLIREYSLNSEVSTKGPILNGEKVGKATDILLCPSIRKMEFLIEAATRYRTKDEPRSYILANVLTNILLSPEPLLLQAFSSEMGWPFPKYFGACGRIAVEEYAGRRLTTLYKSEPFHIRALIAKQLILMANKFGENSLNFILYMTDVSPNNFAVNDNYIIKLIDLDDIILVDKVELTYRRRKSDDYHELHVSESMACDSSYPQGSQCFSFDPDELCDRKFSDHNYYAICAGLLSPGGFSDIIPEGLLHSMPKEFSSKDSQFYNMTDLLEQCKNGDPKHKLNRIEAAQHLLSLLDQYTRQHPV